MLGKFVDEKKVSRIAGTHWWAGTDEIKLARAAKAYDCEMKIVRRKNALRAKRELLLSLKRGFPAVLCVDDWSHWITVVGAERGKFIYMDSREAPVICIDRWRTLKKRWIYHEPDREDPTHTETLFDLHLVIPRFRARTKAHFSLKRARYMRRRENHAFAMHWDEYFSDLTHICQPRTPKSERVFPLGELLRRHGAMIRTQIAFWHGDVKRDQVGKMLRNLQFVADTYALVVRKEDEKRAIVAITANLALWAASKFGVGAVYGNN
jgi:chorismate-pyruvate lyase